jgi:hypothetical protein
MDQGGAAGQLAATAGKVGPGSGDPHPNHPWGPLGIIKSGKLQCGAREVGGAGPTKGSSQLRGELSKGLESSGGDVTFLPPRDICPLPGGTRGPVRVMFSAGEGTPWWTEPYCTREKTKMKKKTKVKQNGRSQRFSQHRLLESESGSDSEVEMMGTTRERNTVLCGGKVEIPPVSSSTSSLKLLPTVSLIDIVRGPGLEEAGGLPLTLPPPDSHSEEKGGWKKNGLCGR